MPIMIVRRMISRTRPLKMITTSWALLIKKEGRGRIRARVKKSRRVTSKKMTVKIKTTAQTATTIVHRAPALTATNARTISIKN